VLNEASRIGIPLCVPPHCLYCHAVQNAAVTFHVTDGKGMLREVTLMATYGSAATVALWQHRCNDIGTDISTVNNKSIGVPWLTGGTPNR
jgi:hypothetical protein